MSWTFEIGKSFLIMTPDSQAITEAIDKFKCFFSRNKGVYSRGGKKKKERNMPERMLTIY